MAWFYIREDLTGLLGVIMGGDCLNDRDNGPQDRGAGERNPRKVYLGGSLTMSTQYLPKDRITSNKAEKSMGLVT